MLTIKQKFTFDEKKNGKASTIFFGILIVSSVDKRPVVGSRYLTSIREINVFMSDEFIGAP